MRKVTVITLQNVRNYGSVLQAFATQQFFRDLGCEVDFINYMRSNISSLSIRAKIWCKGKSFIKRWVYTSVLYPTFLWQDIVFKRFLKKYLNVQNEIVTTKEDFAKIPITSDIYVTGSDQTWNSSWNGGILPELFLDFVPNEVKKISYAASMGKGKLDDGEKQKTKLLLERYDAISVRESTAVEIISDLGIKNVVQVIDPTLQMNRHFWMQYVNIPNESDYVLVYQLNSNSKFDAYAKELARRTGKKLLRLCTRFDQFFKPGKSLLIPQVTDFISLIVHADCVITDSFHATAFSINMNTNFISIYPQDFGGRLESLLQLTELEDRHLKSYGDFSFTHNMQVDFTNANAILERERKKTIKWIKKTLN